MSAGIRYVVPYETALDAEGVSLPGAKLYFYASGTSTPLATYSDQALTIPNTNPVISDAGGLFGNIFLQSAAYKVVLKESNGAEIWTADPIIGGSPVGIQNTIANIADLRSATVNSAYVGSLVYVLGYYEANDGGGGFFEVTDQNPGAENGGTIIYSDTAGFFYVRHVEGTITPFMFGAKGDGSFDDSLFIQSAIDLMGETGGAVYFKSPPVRYYLGTTGITLPGAVAIYGDGKYETIVRYSGTGAAVAYQGSVNSSVQIGNMTIDVTADGAKCLDCSRFLDSTFYSLRLRTISGSNQFGDYANIPVDVTWNSFFNVFIDVTYENLATASYRLGNSTQQPNRHRFASPTFINCFNCFDWTYVHGAQIVAPVANDITGTMFLFGANNDRIQISVATMEAVGATMFAIDPTSNRTGCFGFEVHNGNLGITTSIGLQGRLQNTLGTYFSTAVSAFPSFEPTPAENDLTYGVAINTDSSAGKTFIVTVTDGVAFTMVSPTNGTPGQELIYVIRNASGGAMGAITWGAFFRTSTFTNPANGFSRSIQFNYNGTLWIEQFKSPSDVQN